MPTILPDSTTQVIFIVSIRNSFTISFDSWTADKKFVNKGLEFLVDIGSAHKTNSPKFLIAAHQTLARIGTSKKGNSLAVFDNSIVQKHSRNIDRIR